MALVGSVSQSCANVQSCVIEETGDTFVVGFDPREAFVVHAAVPRVAAAGGRWQHPLDYHLGTWFVDRTRMYGRGRNYPKVFESRKDPE